MTHFRAYWLTCISMMVAAAASATTIVLPTDEQLIAKSPAIVRGTVVSSMPVERDGGIWTETVVQIEESLKGSLSGTIMIRELGGEVGGRFTRIFGTPEYVAGERILAFVTPTPRGDYQTVDLFVGKFREGRTLDGQRLWLRSLDDPHVSILDGRFRPVVGGNVQRDADKFDRFIAARVRGRSVTVDYEVSNPVIAPDSSPSGGFHIDANFTLISEPTIYRWFAFERGESASWFSYGTQSGYSGGGVTELQNGISAWTSYTAALIRYGYSGTFNSPAGQTRRNGINEVLFNDPLGEISGSYSKSTGGVVGQGGFNGVTNGGSWTSPFTADASHPQRTYSAYDIVEGNLTIQDGVSPQAGVSSYLLAEILAHEFGHTLGFGHSSDSTALMYATLAGGGPSLRADDQVAARWLYPNGSSAPPPSVTPPAAPTGLTGSVSGNSVTLQWNDNATNESGYSIYYAAGSGSFAKAADLAANSRGATLSGFSPGTYRLYVTAFNSAGESSPSNTITVTIGGTVTASFRVSPGTSGIAGTTTFTFTDESTGDVAWRQWNLGDGTSSTASSVTKVYAAAGQFPVTLTVGNGSSQSQSSTTMVISAPQVALAAGFSFSPSTPVVDGAVSFVDQSSGGPTAWQWSFGDGTGSSQQNPVKQFVAPGGYVVTLTVYRGSEARSVSKSVTVGPKAAVAPYQSLISAAAQTSGVGGSNWRTELVLFNAGNEPVSVSLTFVPGSGSGIQSRSLFLSPRQSQTYGNVLRDIFGMPSGAGAITVEATSTLSAPQLRITSRTFDDTGYGTYGQAIPDVTSDALQQTMYVAGMHSNAGYRTNVGLVNRSASATALAMTLYTADGGTLATRNVTLAANSFQQASLATWFPEVAGGSYSGLSMRVSASGNAASVYASVVDNNTQDPIYIPGVPAHAGKSLTIPVVGRSAGANGTFWRSDITLFNPHSTGQSLTLRYGGRTRSLSLEARQTTILTDIVTQMGLESGLGPLEVSWDGSGPVVSSRNYTNAARGTYGQSIDPVASYGSEVYVAGLRSDTQFRSNLGFLNNGTASVVAEATLLSPTGSPMATAAIGIPAKGLVQVSVANLFPGLNASAIGNFTLQVRSGAPTIFAYGSMIDNATGDPVFFAGK